MMRPVAGLHRSRAEEAESHLALLSVEYHFAFLTNKFFARLLARSQWSQLKLHSSEMALTQNFSRQNRAIFLNQRQTKQRRNASASDAILFARLSERASGAASFLPQNGLLDRFSVPACSVEEVLLW